MPTHALKALHLDADVAGPSHHVQRHVDARAAGALLQQLRVRAGAARAEGLYKEGLTRKGRGAGRKV